MNIVSDRMNELEIYDELMYTKNDNANTLDSHSSDFVPGFRPIISVIFGQGQNKIIRPGHVEFTDPIICQKITIKGINCNPADLMFELVSDTGQSMHVVNGDSICLYRTTWFVPTKYRLTVTYGPEDFLRDLTIAEFSVSWPSRNVGPNVRNDFISLIVIQSDAEISLPKRTFWNMWSRLGTGINVELEEYRKTGTLGPAIQGSLGSLFKGLRSVFENGTDRQISALVYWTTGMFIADPAKFRFKGSKGHTAIDLADLVYDIGIMFGYEFPISDELLMYFRPDAIALEH